MAKSNLVTRRVIESRTYDVYKNENGALIKIGTETIKGRVNTKELAAKYGVDQVVTAEVSCVKKVYGVPVDKFMEIAVEVTE